jgi:hypothetical protein
VAGPARRGGHPARPAAADCLRDPAMTGGRRRAAATALRPPRCTRGAGAGPAAGPARPRLSHLLAGRARRPGLCRAHPWIQAFLLVANDLQCWSHAASAQCDRERAAFLVPSSSAPGGFAKQPPSRQQQRRRHPAVAPPRAPARFCIHLCLQTSNDRCCGAPAADMGANARPGGPDPDRWRASRLAPLPGKRTQSALDPPVRRPRGARTSQAVYV